MNALINLLKPNDGDEIDLFTDYRGIGFVTFKVNNKISTLEISSSQLKNKLKYLHYTQGLNNNTNNSGENNDLTETTPYKLPSKEAVAKAVEILEIQAIHSEIKKHPSVRLGQTYQGFEIDLGDDTNKVIQVTSEGYRVVEPTIPFIRTPEMQPLCQPAIGSGFNEFFGLLSITDPNDKKLIIVWLLSSMRPKPPYFILLLLGEQGSSKSTTSTALKYILDPSDIPLRSLSNSERDLVINLNKRRVVCFDNLSKISDNMSDALCRASVGNGFSTRKLYTDSDEVVFKPQNPMILNGINNIIERQDLISRSIVIELPTIKPESRITEKEYYGRLEEIRPKVLGELLKHTCCSIANIDSTDITHTSRMADAELWVTAAEQSLEWEIGETSILLEVNQLAAIKYGLEAEPLSEVIIKFMNNRTSTDPWEGTSTALLEAIGSDLENDIPKTANTLSFRLGRLVTALRMVAGLEIQLNQRQGGTGQRFITIKKIA